MASNNWTRMSKISDRMRSPSPQANLDLSREKAEMEEYTMIQFQKRLKLVSVSPKNNLKSHLKQRFNKNPFLHEYSQESFSSSNDVLQETIESFTPNASPENSTDGDSAQRTFDVEVFTEKEFKAKVKSQKQKKKRKRSQKLQSVREIRDAPEEPPVTKLFCCGI